MLVKLAPGELFGEISFLDSGNRGAGAAVFAEGECECMVIYHNTVRVWRFRRVCDCLQIVVDSVKGICRFLSASKGGVLICHEMIAVML